MRAQLTELKALLGCVGEVRFVCGCVSQLQDGRYFLEDMSEELPVDLACAARTSGFFLGALLLRTYYPNPTSVHSNLKVILGQTESGSAGCVGLEVPLVFFACKFDDNRDGQSAALTCVSRATCQGNGCGPPWGLCGACLVWKHRKSPLLVVACRRELHRGGGGRAAAQRRVQGGRAGLPAPGDARGVAGGAQGALASPMSRILSAQVFEARKGICASGSA